MLVAGKYVEFDEKGSIKIQKRINAVGDLKSDLKSEVDPKVAMSQDGVSPEFTGFSLFDYETPDIVDRKTRYSYYREMDTMEFIHRALEIVADDSTQANDEGNAIKIYSNDEEVKGKIEDLFYERLDMNNELWSAIYETAKMGDNFYEVIPDNYDKPSKIIFLRWLEPDKIERIERNGKLLFYQYKAEDKKRDDRKRYGKGFDMNDAEVIYKLQPWQIIHFKVNIDKEVEPYGGSLLKAGIRTFRRLSLLEDVMLVYRISRAPERRVFYIDVGNMNVIDAKKFIRKIKDQYRTQNFIDEKGNINKRANVLSITSDIFVPRREGGQSTEISTLPGGEALKTIDDLDYFKNKILRTMNIPMAYLGDESDRSRGNLSQQDIKFARFIERIQTHIVKGMNKIAALELFFTGQKKEDLNNFRIELTPPSNIKELTEIDLINQRMGVVGTIQGLQIFSNEWILRKILKFSDKEISDIILQKSIESRQQAAQGGGEMGFGGEMGGGFGGEMGGALPPEMGAPPPGGEALPPEMEAPGEAPPLAASTIINVLGKDFLIENKDDFFKMMKYLKEDRKYDEVQIFESISDLVRAPVKPRQKMTTGGLKKQILINEFGGLIYGNGDKKKRAIKLYERNVEIIKTTKNKKKVIEEAVTFEERVILLED